MPLFATTEQIAKAQQFEPAADAFRDRTYLVTGAGQGLGKALAKRLASLGATVLLHGRVQAKLEAVYDEIVDAGNPEPAMLPMDFATASEQEIESLVIGIRKEITQLHGLIHCAVDCPSLTPVVNQKMDDLLRNYRVNVAAPIAMTRACLPLLTQTVSAQKTNKAKVIFTGETHGVEAKPFWASLALSKGALVQLMDIWPGEFTDNVPLDICAIVPGPIATPQRFVTHPGELGRNLRTAESVLPVYLSTLLDRSSDLHGRSVVL